VLILVGKLALVLSDPFEWQSGAQGTLKPLSVFLSPHSGFCKGAATWVQDLEFCQFLGWRLREKAANALHVVAVLIAEALDQISFLGPRTQRQ
jgi:hypothetical protein